jgi:hypothetical protein
MSCAISRAATGTELGADCGEKMLAAIPQFAAKHSSDVPPSRPCTYPGVRLTLLQPVSWRRHCGRTSASTRQTIRERKRSHQWGGRCSSASKKLPRSKSKPRAISSNSSAMPSICMSSPPDHMMPSTKNALELAGGVGLGRVFERRTEEVLLVALRVALPAERAVRRADRANMLSVSWLGARRRWINGGRWRW